MLLSAMLLVTAHQCYWNSYFQSSNYIHNITADSVTIGVDSDSEISTTTGVNLILDSATGETQVDDNLTVTGTLDVNGNTHRLVMLTDAHAFVGVPSNLIRQLHLLTSLLITFRLVYQVLLKLIPLLVT